MASTLLVDAIPARLVDMRSALDSPTPLSLHQGFDFGHVDPVEIAEYGVLEAGRRRGELERALIVLIGGQAINESGRERISRADPIDDVGDVVLAAGERLRAIVQYRRPSVVIGAVTLAQRNCLLLEIGEFLQHLFR